MAKAIKIIRNEHLGLAAIYRTLSGVLQAIEEGREQPNFDLFHALINYLKNFMYQYHHPKENDYLFPAIVKYDRQTKQLVEKLEKQHKQGADLLKHLDNALKRYEQEGDTAFENFRDAFEEYHQFEWQHMKMEEEKLIPLAKSLLSDSDWASIDSVFLDHEDPLFGDEKRTEFQKLFDTIARMAPEPYGLRD